MVGVLPRDFYVPWRNIDSTRPEIVTPLATDFNNWGRGDHKFYIVGRFKDGVDVSAPPRPI